MPVHASLYFQDSASPSMEQLTFFHDLTFSILCAIITLVGMSMLIAASFKLIDRSLLQSQSIEIIWTVMPVGILMLIALPSLQVLYLLDDPFMPSLSLKAVGHQWFWSYEYSDFPELQFDSYLMEASESQSQPRLLGADNTTVLPTNSQIRVVATASDVIHAWAVPALGVKADAVPGRLNQLMFLIKRPGLFYGQCSEICGANHSFMPIVVEACPMESFISWVSSKN
uniref:Cytochrome c oxidase subunit 2 n=1 Tax=Stygobromus foliatus TaxID=1678291 RepID=A0A172QHD9_9CRUS|nr:cytochrome c oxidase subunit II [Stygobromus foliatus]